MALQDVDLNDLELGSEVELEGFDPEQNFFAAPPPPDDGTYIAKLKLQAGRGAQKGTDKNGREFYQTSVEARISDGGKFDNRPVFDRVNTIVLKGGTRVGGILQALGVKPPSTAAAQIKTLIQTLEAEPQGRVTTRWRSSVKDVDGTYKEMWKGQKNHPSDGNGGFRHVNRVVLSDKSEVEVVAQAEIVRYAPLS